MTQRMSMQPVVAAALAVVVLASFAASVTNLTATRSEDLFDAASRLPYRTTAARLTALLPYRPLQSVTRSAKVEEVTAAAAKVGVVTAELAAATRSYATSLEVRAIAAGYLLTDRDERAIERLESCLGEHSRDAELLADLAAAYTQRATRTGNAADWMSAAGAAARAYKLAPTSPQAAWNRAVTLQAIGLSEEARTAWNDYLRIDARSAWADEARQKLAALDEPTERDEWKDDVAALTRAWEHGDAATIEQIAVRFPVRVHALAVRQWIPQWAVAVVRADRNADLFLHAIDGAALGIAKSARDEQLRDFMAAVRRTSDRSSFARAHTRFVDAEQALREHGTMEAVAIMRDALTELRRVGSPLAATAVVDLGGHLYHAAKYVDALRVLDPEARVLARKAWPLLNAIAEWNRAVALTSLGRIERAGAAYRRAIALYRNAGDPTHLGMFEMLLGHNAETAHDSGEAWTHYLEGLRMAGRHGDPDRQLVVLDTFCRAALRADRPDFAEILNDALMARSEGSDWVPYRCHALITRCDIENRRGNERAAAEQCRAAAALWSSIVDVSVRDRLEADLELSSAAVADDNARIENLTRAVDVSTRRRDVYRLSRVLLMRGRAYVEAGATALARADLERGMEFLEQQRAVLETVPDRLTFFETSRATARELVRLLVNTGAEQEALGVIERVRARALIDSMATPNARQLSLANVQSEMEPGRALLEYWADDRDLFVWIIRRDAVKFVRQGATREAIENSVQRLLRAFASESEDETESAAVLLAAQLLAPVEPFLKDVSTLTIVPDDLITDVPFGALRETSDARFLLERYSITATPSASAYAIAHARSIAHDSILIVANPETGGAYPTLDVRGETKAAQLAMRNSLLVTGAEATADAIRSSAQRFDTLHIATHALRDSESGEPALVFADGLLSTSEVETTIPARVGSLVVLAACSTSRGRSSMDGNLSLARAFVAAGASAVVASLWDTDDRDAQFLFKRFYEELARGASAADALRVAQLSLFHRDSNVRPRRWAAYQIWGGA